MTTVSSNEPSTSALTGRSGRSPAPDGEASAGDANPASVTAAADFETFLSLLTTQMRTQDPLNPVQSTEFVAQLAAFSSVEQQIVSNDRLGRIEEVLSRDGEAHLSTWIGREVETVAAVRFDGEPLVVRWDPRPVAAETRLLVRNDEGVIFGRLALDPSAAAVSWSGRTDAGVTPSGLYSFEVERVDEAGAVSTSPAATFAPVREVRYATGGVLLALEGGSEVAPADVLSVR